MNKEQFVNTFSALAMIYGKEFTESQISTFYLVLNDLEINKFKMACGNLAKKMKFMPTVADIREEVAKINGGSELDLEPEHEWNEILYCIRHYGPYQLDKIKNYLNPFTFYIAEKMGWDDLFNLMTSEKDYVGHRFIEYFKNNQQTYKERLQLGNTKELEKLDFYKSNIIHRIEMN